MIDDLHPIYHLPENASLSEIELLELRMLAASGQNISQFGFNWKSTEPGMTDAQLNEFTAHGR